MKKRISKFINFMLGKYFILFKHIDVNSERSQIKINFNSILQNSGKFIIHGKVNISQNVRIHNKNGFVEFGDNIFIRDYVKIRIARGVFKVGNNTTINDYSLIYALQGGVVIGNNVRIAPFVKIIAENHNFEYLSKKGKEIYLQGMNSKGITIGDNVWVGTNVVILDGVNIGNNVVIGAGSVITKSIKSNSLVAGNPGKLIRRLI